MAEIVEVQLSDGETILVEIATTSGDVRVLDHLDLNDAKKSVGRIASWARDSVLRAMPNPPTQLEVEFGIKLAVKSGTLASVLAQASGEATLVVKMKWDRSSD